ncbi:hypothetical protein DFH08DRAFT_819990 [Mycena albidolilacea]|uniref:Uncharacterized protein n=1 Tax=Mycena albidolilacea TaxID=1033008 RepID=A0AAD6ZD52_9AGAR|nr:hypothetical protein DFH08DRAFT_819990 [Mycena albidolilacea]
MEPSIPVHAISGDRDWREGKWGQLEEIDKPCRMQDAIFLVRDHLSCYMVSGIACHTLTTGFPEWDVVRGCALRLETGPGSTCNYFDQVYFLLSFSQASQGQNKLHPWRKKKYAVFLTPVGVKQTVDALQIVKNSGAGADGDNGRGMDVGDAGKPSRRPHIAYSLPRLHADLPRTLFANTNSPGTSFYTYLNGPSFAPSARDSGGLNSI